MNVDALAARIRGATRGAFTAEVNLDETPASSLVDLAILGPAEQILPAVAERL